MITDEQIEAAVELHRRVDSALMGACDQRRLQGHSRTIDAITCALLQVEAIHDLADCVNRATGLAKTVLPK